MENLGAQLVGLRAKQLEDVVGWSADKKNQ